MKRSIKPLFDHTRTDSDEKCYAYQSSAVNLPMVVSKVATGFLPAMFTAERETTK